MKQAHSLGVVVLAAGASRRLGQPKQLLPFRGRPLLCHVMDQTAALPLASRVLVLGAYAADIQAAIGSGPWTAVTNPDWATGMGSSLRWGVAQSLSECPEIEHLLCLVSDQPLVSEGFLNVLINKHIESKSLITASEYQGGPGVPAVFSRACFAELMALEGDQGARKLFKIHAHAVQRLPFEGGSFDIDSPEDLQRLQAMGWTLDAGGRGTGVWADG
jgi:molybdenum cofactor cytidylyltransferase